MVKCPVLNWGPSSKANWYLSQQAETLSWKESWRSSSSQAWHPTLPRQRHPPPRLCSRHAPFLKCLPPTTIAKLDSFFRVQLNSAGSVKVFENLPSFSFLGRASVSLLRPWVALYLHLFYTPYHLPCPGVICTQVWLSQWAEASSTAGTEYYLPLCSQCHPQPSTC